MAEVGKIIGPAGSPESEDKKTAADAEKFAAARKRVAEVSAVDPDEQKNGKDKKKLKRKNCSSNQQSRHRPLRCRLS